MVVLFYNKDFHSRNAGGVDRISYNLGSLFVEQGMNVIYLSSSGEYRDYENISSNLLHFPNEELEADENKKYFSDVVRNYGVKVVINQAAMSPQYFRFLRSCAKEWSSVKIISCVHNLVITPGVNWGYQHEYSLSRKKLGFISNLFQLALSKRFLKFLYIRKYRQHYRNLEKNSSYIVSLCDGHKVEIEDMLGYSTDKIVVIPNCISSSEVCKPVEKEKIVLWVGRLDFSVKRVDIMLKVWREFLKVNADWHLYILGTSSLFEDVKEMAKSLELSNIHFEGSVDPSSYYDKASVTFVTSSHESFSMVILESLYHKVVPIVYNTFPAASFLITKDINGFLIEPYDIKSGVSCLYNLTKDDDKLKIMRESAYKSSLAYISSEVLKLWETIIY